MRTSILALAIGVCFANPVLARHGAVHHQAAPTGVVMPRLPSQPAFETSRGEDAACKDGARLLSHAAYMPAADNVPSIRCGQKLSTDTLMTVHRWNQT